MSEIVTKTSLSKKDKMYYIHSIIGLAIMFLLGFLPPFGPVTPVGMKFLGIFLGLVYLWSFVDMGWPILAAFAALVALDCMPITDIYTSAFSNMTVLMCLFTMLVLMPLSGSGIFDYVAAWLLKKPFLKGHPWRITLTLIGIVFLGCIFMGGLAVLFMVYELTFKICDMCGMKRTHPWAGALIVGATVTFVIGGGVFPFSGLAFFMIAIFSSVQAFTWPFLPYMAFMVLMELFVMGFYLIIMKLMHIDMSQLKNADISEFVQNLPPMNTFQKKTAIMLIAFIVSLIVAGLAPMFPNVSIMAAVARLGMVGVSWIFMCLMLIWRIKEKAAFSLNKMAAVIPWDSVLIVCVGTSIGPAIASDATGIGTLLYQLTAPIFGGHSPFVFTLLICLVTLVLTNFFNNTVIAMLMVSIIASFSATMNLNIITMAALMLVASQMAMFLPGASYYAGLAHGQAAQMGRKNGFLWGGITVLATACAMPFMIIIGNMLFG